MKRKRLFLVLACAAVLIAAGTVVWYVDRPKALYRVTFLPPMGGVETDPHAINDSGQVAAVVRWDKSDRMEDLASFPKGYYAVRLCLNNADQIAGTVFDPNRVWSSFFRDADGRTCALDAPGGGEVQMRALNNRGQVVGHWNTVGGTSVGVGSIHPMHRQASGACRHRERAGARHQQGRDDPRSAGDGKAPLSPGRDHRADRTVAGLCRPSASRDPGLRSIPPRSRKPRGLPSSQGEFILGLRADRATLLASRWHGDDRQTT